MWKWLLPISLLFILGLASGVGLSSSGTGMVSSGSGMISSGSGMVSSGAGMSSSRTGSASSVGLPSGTGNTPWQEGAIEGLKIGFHMGQMYTLAQQGQNISGFNAEVDKYSAWVQKNFGNNNNPNLMMPKIQEPGYGMSGYVPQSTAQKPIHNIDAKTTPGIDYGEPLGWV